ncbi:AAA family ATPase [Curtobacterium pusillum]|uniref:ATP-binding protein n=1 Tax=Curtobacterium pusillum TaxID=69373 RepID=UPI00119FEE13|nr:helix-turn-helix transcriptional regulator [Curtobacterium pusillum]
MATPEPAEQPTLLGRHRELALLAAALDGAQATGRAVIVEGEAGIGKTSLLEETVRSAADAGFRVVRCTGTQGSAPVGHGGLHELLHTLVPFADQLPPRQRAALRIAFSLEEGPAPDRLVVGLATLGLLEEAAAHRPLLVAVEDLQWLDRSTVDALMFVVARLGSAHVLLVGTLRSGGDVEFRAPSSVERIPLGPLDPESARLVLDRHAPDLSDASRARVLRASEGNPLALRELPIALHEQGADRTAISSRVPTTRRLERAFLDQLASVPEPSRRLLVLAAAADGAGLHDVMDAAGRLDLSVDDLRPLEERGLVTVVADALRFRHPLLQSAVQSAATLREWVDCHLALAAATSGSHRAVWHRAAAALRRDEVLASELERVAQLARERGAHAESTEAFSRAATLSPGTNERGRRIALAAETAREGGLTDAAVELLRGLDLSEIDAHVLAEVTFTKVLLSLTAGAVALSRAEVAAVLERLPVGERTEDRMKILWGAAVIARGRNQPRDTWDDLSRQIVETPSTSPMKPVALAVLAPLGDVAPLREQLPSIVPKLVRSPIELISLAIAAESLQDLETALTAWELCVERCHELGQAAELTQALRGRAGVLLLAGRLREGLADAEYAERLAGDTSQPLMASMAAATAARARVLLGDPAGARADIERSVRLSRATPLSMTGADARWAAGVAALVAGDHRNALLELAQVTLHPTRALWAIGDRVEAAVRAGRPETVLDDIAEAERAARAYRSPYLSSLATRSRALVAPHAGARPLFEKAIELGQLSESRLETARTRLLFGEWLRRGRHVSEAREQLELAHGEFTTAGARAFADRAASELRAAGGRNAASTAVGATAEPLTPQELQVAGLAAQGLTNKEIADAVYLSHRTVSTHLYRVYPKLGIAARRQVAAALEAAGYEQTAPSFRSAHTASGERES